MSKKKDEPKHIKDLVPDPQNVRRHNPRNIGMIADSMQQVGAARSIVIDENDVILAGNGAIEAAAQAGIENVRVIEASGHEIIAVRRTGLTNEQKRRLALFDNRAAELAEWDVAALQRVMAEVPGVEQGVFSKAEIAELVKAQERADARAQPPDDFKALGDALETEHTCPRCGYEWSGSG